MELNGLKKSSQTQLPTVSQISFCMTLELGSLFIEKLKKASLEKRTWVKFDLIHTMHMKI